MHLSIFHGLVRNLLLIKMKVFKTVRHIQTSMAVMKERRILTLLIISKNVLFYHRFLGAIPGFYFTEGQRPLYSWHNVIVII